MTTPAEQSVADVLALIADADLKGFDHARGQAAEAVDTSGDDPATAAIRHVVHEARLPGFK